MSNELIAVGNEPSQIEAGGEGAKYTLAISYWGGWGYEKHLGMVKGQIEGDEKLRNNFNYQWFKQPVRTAEFEVYLFVNEDRTDDNGGEMVHSKTASKNFPEADWDTFK